MDERNEIIGSIGEKNFLKQVESIIPISTKFLNGFNQDASLLQISENLIIVSNIDKTPTPILVSILDTSYETWGYLSVTSTLSDIYVVGAEGLSFLLSLTIPEHTETKQVIEIIQGAKKACEFYDISFLGGDTKKGDSTSIVGSAIGIIKNNQYLTRDKSKVGDLIITTGVFGGFAATYYKLKNNLQINSKELEYIKFPKFQIKKCKAISNKINLFSASMDNSDGLYNVLNKMLLENNLSYSIDIDKIPFSDNSIELSAETGIPIENFAFFVGDWNSIYSISKKNYELIKTLENFKSIEVIGEVLDANQEPSFCIKELKYKLEYQFENDSFISKFDSNLSGNNSRIFSKESVLKKHEIQ